MKRASSVRGLCLSALALAAMLQSGCGSPASDDAVKLDGAGASFPAPLYDRWFKDYNKAHPEIQINYQSIGSGGGIKALQNETVDFGASDAAMTDEEMAEVKRGVTLLPMTAGSIVLAFNLEGVDELKLSRKAYADIFLGKITKWNDPAIAESNDGAQLPDQPITVVVRADSSGTTFVFTQHLSAISEDFANGPGTGKTVNWVDSDKLIKAKKNDGVAATIKSTPGAIGYVEFGFAEQAKLPVVSLENKAGKFAKPTIENFQAALAGVEMPADLRLFLPDPDGENSYPIVSYTWLLVYNKYSEPSKPEALLEVIEYCLTDGQKISQEMGYIPLPESVVEKVKAAAEKVLGGSDSSDEPEDAGEKAA